MFSTKKEYKRLHQKTSEGEFLYELSNSYELSPKLSKEILQTAKSCLLRGNSLQEGQVEIVAIEISEKSGKSIEESKKKRIVITLDDGLSDEEIKRQFGKTELRRTKIQRITEESIEQEAVLSQEDLCRVLNCGIRTIKRDIHEIRQRGIEVITRGVLHNIGRGQTHKVKIIEMYLEGKTYSEIKIKLRHSVGAIKRYLESFTKVLLCYRRRIYTKKEISQLTGLSEHLSGQYLEIIRESKKDKIRSENMETLAIRQGYREPVKKRGEKYWKTMELLTGGLG